jgi:hypothetical protein
MPEKRHAADALIWLATEPPCADDLTAARLQGKRVARVAAALETLR